MEAEKSYKAPTFPPETQPSSHPPPSSTSSPSHDFSFTISLHPPTPLPYNATATLKLTEPAVPTPDFDLAPADDIFFHGHLLPLHFLSHRPSNASIQTEKKQSINRAVDAVSAASAAVSGKEDDEFKERAKAKTFSSFFPLRKWLKGSEDREADKQGRKRKKRVFEVGRLWKKYASLVERILFSTAAKEKRELRRSPYSFSGDCSARDGGWRRRYNGKFSAPASMRTSPANSGLLVAPPNVFSSSDESSMEELQNAIQAAIAHCKNSVVVKEEKCSF